MCLLAIVKAWTWNLNMYNACIQCTNQHLTYCLHLKCRWKWANWKSDANEINSIMVWHVLASNSLLFLCYLLLSRGYEGTLYLRKKYQEVKAMIHLAWIKLAWVQVWSVTWEVKRLELFNEEFSEIVLGDWYLFTIFSLGHF